MVNALNLDQFQSSFKSEQAYADFVAAMRSSLEFDFRPVMVNGEIIGSTLSAAGTKDILYDRLVSRIARKPEILSELTRRIEEEEIVD